MLSIQSHYFSIVSGLCACLSSFFGKMINFNLFGEAEEDVSMVFN